MIKKNKNNRNSDADNLQNRSLNISEQQFEERSFNSG